MKDPLMDKILASLNNIEQGGVSNQQPNTTGTSTEKDAMRRLLEGLDSAQQSVHQMPGTHKMSPDHKGKPHPASKFLVGGEHEDDKGDIECPVCYGSGTEYGETCVRCGGHGRLTKDGDYIGSRDYDEVEEARRPRRDDDGDWAHDNMRDKRYEQELEDEQKLFKACRKKFPEDDPHDIKDWIMSAKEYDQPLTVAEYADYRRYDDEGNLKEGDVVPFERPVSKLDPDLVNAYYKDGMVKGGSVSSQKTAEEIFAMSHIPFHYKDAFIKGFNKGRKEKDWWDDFHGHNVKEEGLDEDKLDSLRQTAKRMGPELARRKGIDRQIKRLEREKQSRHVEEGELKHFARRVRMDGDHHKTMTDDEYEAIKHKIGPHEFDDISEPGVVSIRYTANKKMGEDYVGQKSLHDYLKSAEDREEDQRKRMAQDFYDKMKEKKTSLKKGENGKFELDEANVEHRYIDIEAAIQNLAHFGTVEQIKEEFKVNNGATYVKLAKKIVEAVQKIRKGEW